MLDAVERAMDGPRRHDKETHDDGDKRPPSDCRQLREHGTSVKPLVDRTIDLYSNHAILRVGSA
jgi:hypothetical protein